MSEEDQRRFIRFNPDKNAVIVVNPDDSEDTDELIGLMRDVSKGGCAGVFHQDYFDFAVGDELYVSTDEIEQVESTIVWQKSIDKRFVKVGFEFSEKIDVLSS